MNCAKPCIQMMRQSRVQETSLQKSGVEERKFRRIQFLGNDIFVPWK